MARVYSESETCEAISNEGWPASAGENEQVFNEDGDSRVGCVRGYLRRGSECVAEDELLPTASWTYFLRLIKLFQLQSSK